jgi:hypothetical protein
VIENEHSLTQGLSVAYVKLMYTLSTFRTQHKAEKLQGHTIMIPTSGFGTNYGHCWILQMF